LIGYLPAPGKAVTIKSWHHDFDFRARARQYVYR
jgi:hypothetical protein